MKAKRRVDSEKRTEDWVTTSEAFLISDDSEDEQPLSGSDFFIYCYTRLNV